MDMEIALSSHENSGNAIFSNKKLHGFEHGNDVALLNVDSSKLYGFFGRLNGNADTFVNFF